MSAATVQSTLKTALEGETEAVVMALLLAVVAVALAVAFKRNVIGVIGEGGNATSSAADAPAVTTTAGTEGQGAATAAAAAAAEAEPTISLPAALIFGDLPIPSDLPFRFQVLEAALSLNLARSPSGAEPKSSHETRDAEYLDRMEAAINRGDMPFLFKLVSRPPSFYRKRTASGGTAAASTDMMPYDFDAIRKRLATHPEEARWRDWQSSGCFVSFPPSILHAMITDLLSPIPLDVLRTVVELDPDAVAEPILDGCNSSILHLFMTCRREWMTSQHLELLVKACPRAVLMMNSIRSMPIHSMLMTRKLDDRAALNEIVSYANIFFNANPSCFLARNFMDDTPLRIAAAAWAGFYRLSVGDQVRIMGMEPGADEKVTNGSAGKVVEILKRSFDSPFLSEKYIVELNEGELCTMKRVNLQPRKSCPSWELFLKMLELTYYASGICHQIFAPLRAILLLSPLLVSCPVLPSIHIGGIGDSSMDQYFRGRRGTMHRDNIISYFMHMYPEQLLQKNADGTSLLHTFLRRGVELPWRLSFGPILHAIPEALSTSDPTGLHPVMMAATGDAFSVDTVYRLLRRDPGLCALGSSD